MVGIPEVPKSRKRKNMVSISFAEEEDIINMEDVDPSIGKFRNMVSTTIIPNKVYIYNMYVRNSYIMATEGLCPEPEGKGQWWG